MVNDLKFEGEIWEVWVYIEDLKENLLLIKTGNTWNIIKGHIKDGEACVDGALRILREAFGVGTLKIDLLFNYTYNGIKKFVFQSKLSKPLDFKRFTEYRWEEPCNIVNYNLEHEFEDIMKRYIQKML